MIMMVIVPYYLFAFCCTRRFLGSRRPLLAR